MHIIVKGLRNEESCVPSEILVIEKNVAGNHTRNSNDGDSLADDLFTESPITESPITESPIMEEDLLEEETSSESSNDNEIATVRARRNRHIRLQEIVVDNTHEPTFTYWAHYGSDFTEISELEYNRLKDILMVLNGDLSGDIIKGIIEKTSNKALKKELKKGLSAFLRMEI